MTWTWQTVVAIISVAAMGISLGVAVTMLTRTLREMMRMIAGFVHGSDGYRKDEPGKTGVISPYRKSDSGKDA